MTSLINNKTLLNLQNKIFTTDLLPDNIIQSSLFDITRDKKHYFLQFNLSDKKLPHQGFKIHVSCTEENFQSILNTIYNFCIQHKVSFKYISNLENLLNNLSGKSSIWSSGKFITIYPESLSSFKEIITQLYSLKAFQLKKGITISSDRRYKDSNILFYRYGIISGPDVNIYNPNSHTIEYRDYTQTTYKLPSWVKEPFPDNIDDKKTSKYLFKSIIPFKALNARASGSTFLAIDKRKNRKIVLKDAKPGFSEGGISVITSLKNEERNLKKLAKFNFIPNYLGSFTEDKDYFLCEQQMPGISIDAFRANGNKDFLDSNQRKNTIQIYKNVITDIISKLNELHKNNIFLGDLSSTNILIDEEKQTSSFIDISQSFNVKENKGKTLSSFRTTGFYDKNIDTLPALEQDNQQLGYIIISMFCRANMFLFIDKTGEMTINFFKKYASLNQIPKIFVNVVTKLIKEPNLDLTKLQDLLSDDKYYPYTMNDDIYSINSFELSLQKNIYLSQLNHLNFVEEKLTSIDSNTDFIFSDKLQFVVKNIIRNNKVTFEEDIQNKLIDSVKLLNHLLVNNLTDPQIKQLSIQNIFALLLCSIIQAKPQHKEDIKALIHAVNISYQYSSPTEGIFYKTTLLSNRLSPYLSDGTAGMLMILLKFKKKFQDSTYDNEIYKLSDTLGKHYMPQNASLMHGLSGILLGLMNYTKVFHNNGFTDFIKENIQTLPYYAFHFNNQSIIVNPSFQTLDINFENGNKGIIYVIDLAKKMKIIS